jgi:FAD/FMN-containing dehydrogenase
LSADGLIARGNGRSYGDASLGNSIFSTLKLDKIIEFDIENAEFECESGVLLSTILKRIVPDGFFLPTTPGTKFITVGGAIAADVHGKNHHCEGSFGEHVIGFRLLTADGSVVECSRERNAELFRSTCGGMGLTGIVLSSRFRLKRIETSYINQATFRAPDLESAMRLFDDNAGSTYSVAWIDCLSTGRKLGRSHLIVGEHARAGDLPRSKRLEPLGLKKDPWLSVPFFLPSGVLNRFSVKTFNELYFRRMPSDEVRSIVHFDPFFYPLDSIGNWNRIYGRRGFVQYQFVLPKAVSYDGLIKVIDRVAKSGSGSFLAVLKLFGKANPDSVMSFPIEGYTLALDFPVNEPVLKLLDELDEIVGDLGGRVYLAKDARMSAEFFHRSYKEVVPPDRFRSAQSDRLNRGWDG